MGTITLVLVTLAALAKGILDARLSAMEWVELKNSGKIG